MKSWGGDAKHLRRSAVGFLCLLAAVVFCLAVAQDGLMWIATAVAQDAERPPKPSAPRTAERNRMVDTQIAARGVKDALTLGAMRKVPRHEFVPENVQDQAYDDHPLPIGLDQTISQPYIVAVMTEAVGLKGGEKVLEIGTGSGYQAAILAEIAAEVYTIEILEPLATRARQTLLRLGYKNVHVRAGDGYQGWPEAVPFDSILVTAAPDHVPPRLVEQLKLGGRMLIPVGEQSWGGQELKLIVKTEGGYEEQDLMGVRFVPMTGEAQKKK